MPSELPTERDFDPYGGDLDAQCAWKNLGGLTLDEAYNKFNECPEIYQEDFMFMGGRAFAYYFSVLDRFLRRTLEIPPEDRNDRQSWIIPQCIKSQFEGKNLPYVQHLRKPALELCEFMLRHIDEFTNDWDNGAEIEEQWRLLSEHLSRCR